MPALARVKTGGCLGFGEAFIPAYVVDNLQRGADSLRVAKFPKSAKTLELFLAACAEFPDVGTVSDWRADFSDTARDPVAWHKAAPNGPSSWSVTKALPAKGFVSAPVVRFDGKASDGSLIGVSHEAFALELKRFSDLHDLTTKVSKALTEKMGILSKEVPELYRWRIDVDQVYNNRGGPNGRGGYDVKGCKWAPVMVFSSPFSQAGIVQKAGYEFEFVDNAAESFAVTRSFAIFHPQSGNFMSRKGYLSATLADAAMFEDLASAKRSRSANRVSKSTFVCELEVRAKRVALNDADLPEGDFAAATVVAERIALAELVKNADDAALHAENERLRELAGVAAPEVKKAGPSI